MIHGNIPLYNSYSSLDTSQGKKRNRSRKKKITTQATEKPLPAPSSEPFNTGHGAKKSLNQRKSKSIPQTIHQYPDVDQSVHALAVNKTTHAGRLAADDQGETYFNDALSESGSESQDEWFDALQTLSEDTSLDDQSTLPEDLPEDLPESHNAATRKTRKLSTREKNKEPAPPDLLTKEIACFSAKTTHYSEKPKAAALHPYQHSPWQNKLLDISEKYFNKKILPYLKEEFRNKNNYNDPFSLFRKLVNRPLTDLKAMEMTVLSELVLSLIHHTIPFDYRISALEFAIQAYTTADSPIALQHLGFRLVKLLRAALTVESVNKKISNYSHTSHPNNMLSEHHAQYILSSMISLYKEVEKKHAPDYFFTLLIPSHTNYSYRTELFSLMAKLFTLKDQQAALAVLVETEDTAPIDTWEMVLQNSVQEYTKEKTLWLAWTSINTGMALMTWIIHMYKQKDKIGDKKSALSKYFRIEPALTKALTIIQNIEGPASIKTKRFETNLAFCEISLITFAEARNIIPHTKLVNRLKEALNKNGDQNKQTYLVQKNERHKILKSLVHTIVEFFQKKLVKEEIGFYPDIFDPIIHKQVNCYITEYQETTRVLADLHARKQDNSSTTPLLSNKATNSASEELNKHQRSLSLENSKEDGILMDCCFQRILCTISKQSLTKKREQYKSTIKKKLDSIKLNPEKRDLEIINWLLLVNLPDAKAKLEETKFDSHPLLYTKARLLIDNFDDYEEAINILTELIPQNEKSTATVTRQQNNSTPTHLQAAGNVESTPEKAGLSDLKLSLQQIDKGNLFSLLAISHKEFGLLQKKDHKLKEHLDKAFSYAHKSITLETNLTKHAGCLQKVADSMKAHNFKFSDYKSKLPDSLTELARLNHCKITSWPTLTQFLHSIRDSKRYDFRGTELYHDLDKKK